ncbi:MAG: endolytic transglycosylase MltG [Candidatus Levybacteria bacterium]|nr:endolytic transglycosylase MltG [Candidatus Levybacteria bacterium]
MKKLAVVMTILIVSLIVGVLWWQDGTSPVNSINKEPTIFVIQKGAGIREISNNLKQQGLIKNSIVFFLLVKQLGLDKKIEAGDFRLNPSMNTEEIAQNLTHGTLDIWITIPEGKRASEIAEILQEKMSTYDSSWKNFLSQNEGYLFPDTYLISKDADIEMIVTQMLRNFEQKYATIDTNGKDRGKIVTLASLIEREAITDAEKPIIAGILTNRLNVGMALQVDATIQYAKGKNGSNNKWWEPVSLEEYKSVKSDYNTYLFTGFPPGPISNPGLEALRAAANPSKTDYFYYLHDASGKIRYAKTLQEHNANIQRYGL